MIPQTKTSWDGRLGIEIVGKVKGCCVETILDWRPQMIGQKLACHYCNGFMKTVRAGEVLSQVFNGGFGLDKTEFKEPELSIGGLYFSTKRFENEEQVKSWMQARECGEPEEVQNLNGHAFYAPIERVLPQSLRLVFAGAGVLAEIGVSEKDVTGAGQMSMQPPAFTTTSMAGAGTAHPAQAPAAVARGTDPGTPDVLHGMCEGQDGHKHEFHLSPVPDEGGGTRVKGFTSFNNGHAHMIEAALSPDGSLDSRTAPDQAPVGGHAHAHRVIWAPGSSVVMRSEKSPNEIVSDEAMNIFRSQLQAAVKKAKGKFAPATA